MSHKQEQQKHIFAENGIACSPLLDSYISKKAIKILLTPFVTMVILC